MPFFALLPSKAAQVALAPEPKKPVPQSKHGHTTSKQIAELNTRMIDAPRGGAWSAVQVQRVLIRVGAKKRNPQPMGQNTLAVAA